MKGQRAATSLIWAMLVVVGLGSPIVFAQGNGGASGEADEQAADKQTDKEATNDQKSGDKKSEAKKKEDFDAHSTLRRANKLAARNALSRSIPLYEKVLKNDWKKYTSAHFNLAEVLRAKEEYARALLHYQAYVHLGDDPGTKSDAKRGLEKLRASVWDKKFAKLSVEIEPKAQSTIEIDGFVVAQNNHLEGMDLLAGEYKVRANAKDHHPKEKSVTLEHEGSASLSFDLKKKIFFGTARVSVDQDGATVKFHPKDLDNPRSPDEPVVKQSPLEQPVKLETGKWLLEVTKPKFHRWVRYVNVQRGKEQQVSVELSKKLPEEIR